jgi:alginate production protein
VTKRALLLVPLALALAVPPRVAHAGEPVETIDDGPDEDEEEEEEGLQQRLTEREDKRRPLEPWTAHPFGHTLTLGGEYELELVAIRPRVLEAEVDGKQVSEPDQLLMEHQLEVEAFYTIGKPLSAFVQLQAVLEEDLLGRTFEDISDRYVERGEMWLYTEDILGSGMSVDVGRLDFEDDRRWWWDDELDAARITWEGDEIEIAGAVGYELASNRTDRSWVDPEQERVLRFLVESSWDFDSNHSFQIFFLHHDDHSPTERVGESVDVDREDDSDARLSWVGLRQTGIFDGGPRGLLGYWVDAGLVRGREREIEFGDVGDPVPGRIVVEELKSHDVSGFAVDVGTSWLLPLRHEPRLFAGWAYGSEEYRQSGLEENEAGFGGVERFDSYGALLRPELSNLNVVTVGAGLSLFRSSSLDLAYHYYRLHEPAEDLGDSELQFELDDEHRELGHELDLVLALEEWERLEFTIAAAVLRTEDAFGSEAERWVVGGFFAVRYAF